MQGPHQLVKVMGCNPRTIRWRALEYGLADPAPPVFQTTHDADGAVSRLWHSSSTPARSLIAEDPNALDRLVRDVLQTFPCMGRQKLDGVLKARGYHIPRERLRESYIMSAYTVLRLVSQGHRLREGRIMCRHPIVFGTMTGITVCPSHTRGWPH